MITQLNKKQLKQVKNQSQSGRSMVEMLGVLAIIGVLSIGGIVGYKLAMNHYQASQIAHEMNIMRTDAQIKIAQGTENLTLGSPYDDEHKINFNDYGTDFGCIYMENENATPDPAFCTAANAYYIELKEIPESVCRPLANLIDKMDNEIAFYINDKSVDAEEGEKGACGEGINTLKVIFGADSDSEAIKCNDEGDPNCPKDLPVCLNHVCVECETYHDCQGETPQCDEASHTCKSCAEIDPEKPLWNDIQCVECKTNEDCLAKGTDEPICNTTQGKCEPCPNEGESWSDEFKECIVTSCQTNNECNINGKTGYYCFFTSSENCEQQTGFGTCRLVDYDLTRTVTINGTTYYASENTMSWFSACHLCTGKHRADDLKCNNPGETWGSDYMADYSILQCSPEMDMTKQTPGWCYKNGTGAYNNSSYSGEDLSDSINILRTQIFGCSSTVKGVNTSCAYYFWLKNSYDACHAYYVSLATGLVMQDDRISYYDDNLVLCK